jgi:hypothetical protein
MRERDIVSAGVKLVGLFLLLLGAVELIRDGLALVIQLLYADNQGLPEDIWQLFAMVAFGKVSIAIVQVLLGAYLCRGGGWFVSVLCGNTEDS